MQPDCVSCDELPGAGPARAALASLRGQRGGGGAGKQGGLEGPWGWQGRAFWSAFLFQLFLFLSVLPASRFLAVSAEGRGLPESGGDAHRGQFTARKIPRREDAPSPPPRSFDRHPTSGSANLGCEKT